MNKILRYIYIIAAVMMLGACHQDEDDLFTTAIITVTAPEGMQVERIQGTLRLTNLNTQRETVATNFSGASVEVTVLRGSYLVSIEGIMRYRDHANAVQTKRFRAYSSYTSLAAKEYNAVEIEALFME